MTVSDEKLASCPYDAGVKRAHRNPGWFVFRAGCVLNDPTPCGSTGDGAGRYHSAILHRCNHWNLMHDGWSNVSGAHMVIQLGASQKLHADRPI